jgi:hypothetical protein
LLEGLVQVRIGRERGGGVVNNAAVFDPLPHRILRLVRGNETLACGE